MCFLQVYSYDPGNLKAALRGNSKRARRGVVDYKVKSQPISRSVDFCCRMLYAATAPYMMVEHEVWARKAVKCDGGGTRLCGVEKRREHLIGLSR